MGHLTSCQVVALRCVQPSSPQAIIIFLRAQTRRRTWIIWFPVRQKKTFCLQNIREQTSRRGRSKGSQNDDYGLDPAQDNLTMHKLLSDTEAPVTQLAEESFGSSLSKRPGLVWQLSMMRGGWTSGADNLPITREPSCSRLRAPA